jgi:hypothetical protein
MTVVNVLRLLAKDISAWCRVIMMKRSAERGVIADDAEHDPEPEPARQRAVMQTQAQCEGSGYSCVSVTRLKR